VRDEVLEADEQTAGDDEPTGGIDDLPCRPAVA
jgi:hypothetical protein